MSELTEEQRAEAVVKERQISLPYRGPHAIFTDAELDFIRQSLPGKMPEPGDQILQCIRTKINTALSSDSRFRQPLNGASA